MSRRTTFACYLRDRFSSEEGLLNWLSGRPGRLLTAKHFRVILIHASARGYSRVVKLLLKDNRIDPSAQNNLAIRRASENGHAEVVELLLADQRVYSLKLEELVAVREIVVTYLFQRYGQLLLAEDGLLIEGNRDIFEVITKVTVSA